MIHSFRVFTLTNSTLPSSIIEFGLEAAVKALNDAGINYDAVEYATVGYVYGDSTAGQRVLYQLGMTQIPIINVNNNCSTGSTALYQARNTVASGQVDCAMALGFERMARGSLTSTFADRTNPLGKIFLPTFFHSLIFPLAQKTCLLCLFFSCLSYRKTY